MKAKLTQSVYYVGVDDIEAHLFENQYTLHHGMSYNSYLIKDNHTAIVDSVDADKANQWIRQIESVCGDDTKPEYLIVHHMEPDHSAGIERALDRWPELKIVASAKAIAMLARFFPGREFDGRTVAVKEGDTLELGTHRLQFFAAPMIHWPEVMVSYEPTEHILFSADAFGKFGALQYEDDWVNEARRYFINIVGKYGNQVQSLLKKLSDPHIHIIAPLHGPVLTDNLGRYLKLYDCWSSYRAETRGVLVAYSSIYGGTAEAATRLGEMLRSADAGEVVMMDLCTCDQSEAVAQAFRLSGMVAAAPTYDAGIFPPMHDFLHHLSMKGYRNRWVGLVENGSWAPTAARQMRKILEPLPGIEFVDPVVTINSRPDQTTYDSLCLLAKEFSRE